MTVTLPATIHLLFMYVLAGGEKKRNEILQMSVLDAELSILDEIDSGLDIDALKDVASAVNGLTKPETATIMVTHYKVTSCPPAISMSCRGRKGPFVSRASSNCPFHASMVRHMQFKLFARHKLLCCCDGGRVSV